MTNNTLDNAEAPSDRYLREHPTAADGTDTQYPFIGYLDNFGNILELDVALDIADALADGDEAQTDNIIEQLYVRVATTDYWQAEIDNQDENSDQPAYRIL